MSNNDVVAEMVAAVAEMVAEQGGDLESAMCLFVDTALRVLAERFPDASAAARAAVLRSAVEEALWTAERPSEYEIGQEMNEIWTDAAMRGVAQGVFESSFDGTGESVWGAVELARCALTERFGGVESNRRERVMWQVVGSFEEMVVE